MRHLVLLPFLAGPMLTAAPRLAAQSDAPTERDLARLQPALAALQRDNAWTLQMQRAVCEVPAPPFKESARAAWYRQELIRLGYADTRLDAVGNVIAELRGGDGPTVMLAAHLDTVFPEGIDATVKTDGTRMDGIGIGDDCRGLAVVLAVARAVKQQQLVPAGRILFVGNVGEEGAGNLRGVRHLLTTEFAGQVDYFISVDGVGQNVVSRAVGSHRYTITVSGPGGHSYSDFGMPNPTHALGRAIARIADLPVPDRPRTTFNVGIVRGGTSVNSIAMRAQLDIDMRSEDAASLADIDRRIRAAVDTAVADEMARWPGARAALTVTYDTIGIRPTGAQRDDAPIVRAALATAKLVGFSPRTSASSTDANLPIALGIPGIAIDGGGRGDGSHSLAEWYDDGAEGYKGPQWALLLVTALSGLR
jgi:acetylornithine deacetylase/succinyl-diaminopimelate desuccinylase-like protein